MTTKMLVCGAAMAIAMAGTMAVTAQQTGFTRTPVQQGDLSIPGREGVQAVATIQPGAESGRHTHPGEEIAYVLAGEGELLIDGQEPRKLKAGDAFVVPAGTVHDARNTGTTTIRVLGVYVVEKGKPLASPAD